MQVPFVDLRVTDKEQQNELLEAVRAVLAHGHFILGPEVAELESQLAERLGVPHVISVGSGIDGLILALRLRGIGSGDEVIVPSHGFVASAIAIDMVGATPVFADIDEHSLLLSPSSVGEVISKNTRAIMPVHLMGHSCAMDELSRLAADHGLAVIEDCAQAIGARFAGRSVGSFDVGAFSLHPLKILAAFGDAGFITVSRQECSEKLRLMRNLGLIDRGVCGEVSRHSRLDTIQAAMLLVRLRYLDDYLARRAAHAAAYREALGNGFRLVEQHNGAHGVDSAFVIRHPHRDKLIEDMAALGFDLKVHYRVAAHKQPAYRERHQGQLPATEKAVAEIASLPVGPELAASDRDRLIAALLEWARSNPQGEQ